MLTPRQKEILSGATKVVAKNGTPISVSNNYRNNVRSIAKEKSKQDLDSLIFTAKHYPEGMEASKIIDLITTWITHGKPILRERLRPRTYFKDPDTGKEVRFRLPRLHKRDPETHKLKPVMWTQIASRKDDGSLRIQPEIYRTTQFLYTLLEAVFDHLVDISPTIKAFSLGEVIQLEKRNGFTIKASTLASWLKEDKKQPSTKRKVLVIT